MIAPGYIPIDQIAVLPVINDEAGERIVRALDAAAREVESTTERAA